MVVLQLRVPWHSIISNCHVDAVFLSGGGRKIIRVEVSLDGGHLWRQAEIIRHETPTPAGALRGLNRAGPGLLHPAGACLDTTAHVLVDLC